MDRYFDADADRTQVFEILAPPVQTLPLVLASPHSGTSYPPDFLASSRLDAFSLRKSEDSFVDEIFMAAPRLGAPLIRALFPRAFLDANREAFELDPDMFADALPAYVNTRSPRVAAGLGTIAKVVANGEEIYRGKLRFAEALGRVNRFYHPYHAALKRLIDQTRQRFGYCLLLDCHSMPSSGNPPEAASARVEGRFRAGRLLRQFLLARPDRNRGAGAPVAGLYRHPQHPLCRGLHHPPLRPAAHGRPGAPDRNQPRALHG